jgi:hypothetical protein
MRIVSPFILTVLVSASWLLAQSAPPPAILTGIVNLPGLKVAVIEVPSPQSDHELILGKDQREGEIEVNDICPDEGRVKIRIAGAGPIWLDLGTATNSILRTPSIALKNARLSLVLCLYSQCAERSLLQHPLLPRENRLNVTSHASNLSEARHTIETLLVDQQIAFIPDGEKFIIVTPSSEVAHIKPNAPKKADSLPYRKNPSDSDLIVPGMLDLRGANDFQVAALYADLLGKKLDLSQRFPSSDGPRLYCTAVTPISKEEAVYMVKTLLSWKNIRFEPADKQGFVKAVRLNDKDQREPNR